MVAVCAVVYVNYITEISTGPLHDYAEQFFKISDAVS